MMFFRNPTRTIGVAVLLAGALTLTACSASGGNNQSTGPVTLTVQTLASTLPAIKVVSDAYTKLHPNVKFVFSTLTGDSSRGPNIAVLGGAGAPDLGFVELGTGVYSALADNHALVNLNSVYKADDLYNSISKDKIDHMTNGSGEPDGLLMYDAWGSVLFYNKSLFAQAGVKAPANHEFQSMSQFNTLAKAIVAKGTPALGLACGSPSDLGHTVDAMLPTATTTAQFQSYLSDWRPGTKGGEKYTSAPFIKTLKAIANWQKLGITEPGCLAATDDTVLSLFQSGKVGMIQGNSYVIPALYGATAPSFPVGWVMSPPVDAGAKTPFWSYTGDMLVVPTKSQHKAAAEAFLKFFGQEKNLVAAAQANAQLPIIKSPSAADVAGYSAVLKQWIDLERTNGTELAWDAAVPSNIGQTTEVPLLQKLWAGTVTPQQVGSQLQSALESLQSGKTAVPGL
jgi:raffinose/stachyose/melibiose transport system substrate-binding protein